MKKLEGLTNACINDLEDVENTVKWLKDIRGKIEEKMRKTHSKYN